MTAHPLESQEQSAYFRLACKGAPAGVAVDTRDPQRRQPSPGRGAEPQTAGRKEGRVRHIRAVCKAREIWIIHRNETPQRRTTKARTEGIYN